MSLLEFVNVYFSNDDDFIIKNLSFKIEAGDFISIVGPSGSGKSSLLKLCSHLHKPSNGKILYKSIDMLDYDPIEIRKIYAIVFKLHIYLEILY